MVAGQRKNHLLIQRLYKSGIYKSTVDARHLKAHAHRFGGLNHGAQSHNGNTVLLEYHFTFAKHYGSSVAFKAVIGFAPGISYGCGSVKRNREFKHV